MASDVCRDTVYGIHSDADRAGRCLWCREKIGPKMPRPRMVTYPEEERRRARAQDPLLLEPVEDWYYDS